MSFSETKKSVRWAAIAAIAGVGSFVFPLVAPWHLLFPIFATFAVFFSEQSPLLTKLVSSFILAAVLAGFLPSPLAASMLAAFVLARSYPVLGAAVLVLNTSIFNTTQQMISDTLYPLSLEVAAPGLLAISFIVSVNLKNSILAIAALAMTVLIVAVGSRVSTSPLAQMAFAAFPACALVACIILRDRSASSITAPITLTLALLVVSWWWTPPRVLNDAYLLMPNIETSAEAKYFKNYENALAFAGIASKLVADPEDIPPKSLVLLPWLTTPLRTEGDTEFAERIGNLARKRDWIVLLAGDHNDLGGSEKRVESITKRSLLRNDLTVPPGNTDDSGPLHVLSFHDWAAAGSEDTELGVLMEPEVGHGEAEVYTRVQA